MSTVNARLGAFFFESSHFVTGTFAGTGLASVSALDLHVGLGTNVLNSGAVVNFDVLLNGIDVGDIVFTQASGTGAFDYSFGFASMRAAVRTRSHSMRPTPFQMGKVRSRSTLRTAPRP